MSEAENPGQPSAPSSPGQPNPSASAAAPSPTAPTPSAPTPSSPSSPATTRPAYVPETHWDATAGKVKDDAALAKYINDHVAFKAADDSRRLTLPQKPEDYKLELPRDFKPPEGIEFVPDEKDPILPHARAFAQKHGLSQDAFSELVGLRASMDVQMKQQLKDFEAGEVTKLGVNGPARKTAIDTWLKAQLGDDIAKHISATMRTSVQAEAFEKLMANFRTQGAGGPSSAHRDGPDARGEIPNYDKMTFEQRRFAQDQQRRAAAR